MRISVFCNLDSLGFLITYSWGVNELLFPFIFHTRLNGLEEMQNYLASLEIPPHSYELVDPKVQIYGDIAILTLRYQSTSLDGKPDPPWKATSVYRLIDSEWRVVHAHWSLMKDQ